MVTHRQLRALGVGRGAIERRLRRGRLHRLHRGIYLVGHPIPPPLALEMAAVLACGAGAVVSHLSAALLWSLDCPRPQRVEVSVSRPRRPQQGGIKVHRSRTLEPEDVTQVSGVPVTTPARTLLDLAAVVGRWRLERLVAGAQSRGLAEPADLARQLEHHPRGRGTRQLRAVAGLPAGPALTRSEAEARLLALVRRSGLPAPLANARVGPYELDLLWRRERVAVEMDGFAYHSGRAAFERDRRRDAELAARGYLVVRVTWRQLVDEPRGVAGRLARVLSSRGAGHT